MFEDSFKNLVTAKTLGMSTVFIESETGREEGVDASKLEMVDAVLQDVSSNHVFLWRARFRVVRILYTGSRCQCMCALRTVPVFVKKGVRT